MIVIERRSRTFTGRGAELRLLIVLVLLMLEGVGQVEVYVPSKVARSRWRRIR